MIRCLWIHEFNKHAILRVAHVIQNLMDDDLRILLLSLLLRAVYLERSYGKRNLK